MTYKTIWISAVLLVLGVLAIQCGEDLAGEGDFCEKDSDCQSGLICNPANICVKPDAGDCVPPCEPSENCLEGQCVPIDPGTDKDGDGSPDEEDCNDLDATIYPGAYEYCDGADNDCDGLTDEDCVPCTDGAVQDCGTDMGECTIGTQTCTSGKWDTCSGVNPEPESCDGKDNDCDGQVDEVCSCSPGDQLACSANQGICTEGVQSCDAGVWTACTGQLPQPETCDGQDNDCDGLTDEAFNLGFPCTGVGQCGDGVLECDQEAFFDPICDSMPTGSNDASTPETCDGQDNDCDDLTDEGTELDTASGECQLAQDLGAISDDGATEIKVLGNIWPENDVDWYMVNARDDLPEDLDDNCDRFHFSVVFTQNPDGKLLFDVYVDGCDEIHRECLGDTHYERAYDFSADDGGQIIGQCPCSVDIEEGRTVCADESKVIYIRVHAPAGEETCDNYELTITNGTPP